MNSRLLWIAAWRGRRPAVLLWLALAWGAGLQAADAKLPDLAQAAREYRRQLADRVMPYWYDTAVDWQRGGYVLADDAARPARPATEK